MWELDCDTCVLIGLLFLIERNSVGPNYNIGLKGDYKSGPSGLENKYFFLKLVQDVDYVHGMVIQ